MVTTTIPPAGAVSPLDRPETPVVPGPLLVATDTTESAAPALLAAKMLAERCATDVEVVTVVERTQVLMPAPFPIALPLDVTGAGVETMRDRARHQLRALIGDDPRWSIETLIGAPAPIIARTARDRKCELVLTGISRHSVLDRMLGEETAAQIAQLTGTPMLAVMPSMTSLPRTVLIAVDLDSPPIPDTPMLRALLDEATAVYFVNARPSTMGIAGFEPETWEQAYAAGVDDAYERVRGSLELAPGVFRQLVRLTGNPAEEILSFAKYAKVDLIVVGQRRRWALHRRLGGALPARLLRATTCSVLVLPRPRVVAEPPVVPTRASGPRTERLSEPYQWGPRLAELSRRNAGRRVTLEVDDMAIGSQAQAVEYPFAGIDYDRHDHRVEIMLGERIGRRAHLTHSVGAPTVIDILDATDGSALALRVANDQEQALLTFLL